MYVYLKTVCFEYAFNFKYDFKSRKNIFFYEVACK
ncbi:hypothetical protein BHY_0991 (plasmid) [Borrelia nietonii YOR]|uniref:Uncharacterized protein n=2 Tax=Borrelia TaxID=138 RepID=W5SAF7_9SPIR|nr:hypothetical protein BHY_0991 [Borrelia nietonii YOR]AHH14518.1 hypothetical protein BHW_0900020 [Borrelia hermsii MTW]